MTFIVIETQTNAGQTVMTQPELFTDQLQAESRWHAIMSLAAVSNVEEHAAMIINQDGATVRREVYRHPVVSA